MRYLLTLPVWALALGTASGAVCVAVRLIFGMLQWIFVQHAGFLPQAAAVLSPERRALTPLLGATCATAVLWGVRSWTRAERFGEYVEAVRFADGRIPFASTFWRTVSSAFSVATGAAIGREGSMIQFASAAASWLGARAPLGKLPLSRQVTWGVAAAVAAAYQAPIAGIFFVIEIVLSEHSLSDIPMLAAASFGGLLASRAMVSSGPLFAVPDTAAPVLSPEVLWAILLAVVLGALAPVYHRLLRTLRFIRLWPLALLWAGAFVGFLSIWQPAVWGNGDFALLQILTTAPAFSPVVWLLAARLAATAVCVGAGTIGGVFTPTLFAGAAVGLMAGRLMHLTHPVVLALIGLGALLSAVTRAPLMAAFMAVELSGQWHFLPVLLVCNWLAVYIASRLSPESLYAIATPEPAESELQSLSSLSR